MINTTPLFRCLMTPALVVSMTYAANLAAADAVTDAGDRVNPLLAASSLPNHLPRFDLIKDEDFLPAMKLGMRIERAEIAEIANNPAAPTFENTIVAMEHTGALLGRASRVFFNLRSADSNEARQAIEREVRPLLTAHNDAIRLDAALFARIDALYQQRASLGLSPTQLRLLEEYHRDFVRAGAALSEGEKARLRAINTELAQLGTEFSQNVLKEVQASALVVDSAEELAGLAPSLIEAAAAEAVERGLDGKYVLTLRNYSSQPGLSSLENRATRERLMRASLERGSRGGEFDNRETLVKIIALRAERAQLLGYETHADYVLEERTAKTVTAVQDMLGNLAPVAVANARREGEALQAMINKTADEPFELASWDWPYYAEKVRQARFDLDANAIKPYFELDNVLVNGVFYAAEKLYGITFKARPDLPSYHPDVRVWEVFNEDGSRLAFFLGDFYARGSKRGGAWMNAYVSQSGLLGTQPVVANHLNITKPPAGQPTLLTLDEVETLFHEFGHALHGMFSDVEYPSFSGTSVPRDFVEYPSQVNEMWAVWPSVLENYARHYETGEPIPRELLARVIEAAQFNEGYRTTEYLSAAVLDMCYHTLTPEEIPAAEAVLDFEAACLEDAGFDYDAVPTRYRSTYFSHAAGGYSAGYYSYIWSEVLDADSVKWLEENGGLTRANGDHFRNTLLSRGGSKEAMQLFRDFTGRDPDIQPLLERRGLTAGQ
ncbi:MAG: M3 family metallopeptidase [Halieaceae bacterium]|jgi:peptidyl-dipeptidase Dcp|nr:M3 family metallopeptidase [Halieaceae bacterium]